MIKPGLTAKKRVPGFFLVNDFVFFDFVLKIVEISKTYQTLHKKAKSNWFMSLLFMLQLRDVIFSNDIYAD